MKRTSLILLILGLILSQLIIVKFNLNNGFQFHSFDIRLIPIADYASKISQNLYLTSVIIGYILFVLFGVLNTNKQKAPEIFKSSLMFTGIALVVTFFEFTSILEDLNGTFQGKRFHIGWLIFLLGLWIYSKKYISIKKK